MIMRALILLSSALCLHSYSVHAADSKDIFGNILGEISRQIERKQHKKQQRRLQPLWQACASGDVAACDKAAEYPLTPQSRQDLARMRDIAVRRPQFQRDWITCQQFDITACNAAMEFPGLVARDRAQLRIWRRTATQRELQEHRAQADQLRLKREYRQLQDSCLVLGRPNNCHQAANHKLATERDRQRFNRKRTAIARKSEFQRLRTACFAGNTNSCRLAKRHRAASTGDRVALKAQEKKLIAEAQAHQQREHDRRAFANLRHGCLEKNELAACQVAAAHHLASAKIRETFRQKEWELSSLTQQALSFLADDTSALRTSSLSSTSLIVGALTLPLVILAIFQLLRNLLPKLALIRRSEPNGLPENDRSDTRPEVPFFTPIPLTGHMPTDVRRVLYG